MALQLIEGFDHLDSTTSILTKGWSTTNDPSGTYSIQTGRINGSALRVTSGASNGDFQRLTKVLPSTYATVVFGFAFKSAANGVGTNNPFFELQTAALGVIMKVGVTNTMKVRTLTSADATITTGATTIVAGTWNYVEVKVFVNGASSTVEVHLNGAVENASTTASLGSTNVGALRFVAEYGPSGQYWTNQGNIDIDDVYLLDTSGSDNTTFLGDVHVETIYPASDGANDAWTADTGTNSADRVDEHPPDGDTTYIYSSTVNQKTTFDMGTLATLTGTVYGVQTNLYARKDDAATRQIAPVVRQGGFDFDGTNVALSTSYVDYSQIYENDPSDSADWTISKVNSAEFGVKLTV